MRKKSQLLGQVFIFIVAAIIFILILTYGYRAISNFLARSEQVTMIDFKADLESAVEMIKRDYGSVRKVELKVPTRYTELCILDTKIDPGLEFKEDRPLMYAAWQAGGENVFLVPKQETPILLEDITVPGGKVCVPVVQGGVTLRLEGLGKSTQICKWPEC